MIKKQNTTDVNIFFGNVTYFVKIWKMSDRQASISINSCTGLSKTVFPCEYC